MWNRDPVVTGGAVFHCTAPDVGVPRRDVVRVAAVPGDDGARPVDGGVHLDVHDHPAALAST